MRMLTVMRAIKRLLPRSARSAIGRTIRMHRRDTTPFPGRDFLAEVKSRLPHLRVKTIFDIGANIGVIALQYADHFPQATVYAFEPETTNFRLMDKNLVGKPGILRHQIGFGEASGVAMLFMDPAHPSMGRVVDEGGQYASRVTIDTVDHFCDANHVAAIDIMKIDTEGHELQVLSGAKRMLASERIGLIKAEVAADPDMDYHTSFFRTCELLYPYGYRLFGIYEQCENEFSPGPRIRRFDAVFISAPLRRQHGLINWISAPDAARPANERDNLRQPQMIS